VLCPYCSSDSRVLDSRGAADAVRRRRECLSCARRFTTYERLAPSEIRVLKRDGSAEPFSREKLGRVLERLARDRQISPRALDELARGLEAELVDAGVHSITSGQIADRLLVRLAELDTMMVARFASNYTRDDGAIRTAATTPSPQLSLPIPEDPADAAEGDGEPRGARRRGRKPAG
jgi:transcriptional repressor NrdR